MKEHAAYNVPLDQMTTLTVNMINTCSRALVQRLQRDPRVNHVATNEDEDERCVLQ